MDPRAGRAAFRLALLIALTSLAILPFQRVNSPEFVVTIMAAAVGGLFLGAVVLVNRISDPGIPPSEDERGSRRLPREDERRREGEALQPRDTISRGDKGRSTPSNAHNETRGGINERDQAT